MMKNVDLISNVFLTILIFSLSQIFSWFQYNTQFINPSYKNNILLPILLGIPISLGFWYATKFSYISFGAVWPGRLIGFSIGIVVYTILSYFFLKEGLNIKTLVTLLLAVSMIFIQIFWK